LVLRASILLLSCDFGIRPPDPELTNYLLAALRWNQAAYYVFSMLAQKCIFVNLFNAISEYAV
jgi:hypothetical protein